MTDVIKQIPYGTAIATLLMSTNLPSEDLPGSDLVTFFGAQEDGQLKGIVGLEHYGDSALLRSLAVRESDRNRGLAKKLVACVERHADSLEVKDIYLLTTTAEDFFSRLGYVAIDRNQAPAQIAATREFSELCPAKASFMIKSL